MSKRSTHENSRTDAEEPGSSDPSAPVLVSAPFPPKTLARTNKISTKILHAAVLPGIVGSAVWIVEGKVSVEQFADAWVVTVLLVASYLGGWALNTVFERYPFFSQIEAAVVSIGYTFIPVGFFLYSVLLPPLQTISVVATAGSVAVYLVDQFLHQFRDSRLVVIPGGVSYRLLAIPSVTPHVDGDLNADDVDAVVADLHTSRSAYERFMDERGLTNVPTYHAGYVYELLTARVLLGEDCNVEIEAHGRRHHPHVKRLIDLILLALSLPISGPILAGTALAIWLDSGKPIFSWEERSGRYGETFQMVNFQTKEAASRSDDETGRSCDEGGGLATVGWFIQRVRVDRLPQLWNVLNGDMSLIGPRPGRVNLSLNLSSAEELLAYRHLVRPGMTGLAQVTSGFAVDETRRVLEHDLYYVKHQSVTLDLLIVYLTFKTILTSSGAD
ncbi:lipopolysaccharide/colanic/teichoic acid biosynthesis glycosyltransferase [Salinibacter ruber]|uniref:sugar transferase n=1 Tax=Salinibacter ruber TaxID=146919 RepID=UPI0021693781|nr:sugar transferase [Salinibacter ruber]MCS3856506.1 lipopolysaccharide/colanic/teichoic acid biosynthesis glycosyltransferase [Salinibacter ruber]